MSSRHFRSGDRIVPLNPQLDTLSDYPFEALRTLHAELSGLHFSDSSDHGVRCVCVHLLESYAHDSAADTSGRNFSCLAWFVLGGLSIFASGKRRFNPRAEAGKT